MLQSDFLHSHEYPHGQPLRFVGLGLHVHACPVQRYLPPAQLQMVIEKVAALDMDEVRRQIAEQAKEEEGQA